MSAHVCLLFIRASKSVILYIFIAYPCILYLYDILYTFIFQVNDKLIFLCFFIGAIICLAFSTLFHTVSCHSKSIQNIFSRMDYAGIALLIGKLGYLKNFLTITLLLSNNSILIFTLISVGSTIPWLYYGFYCQFYAKLTYIIAVSVCGISVMILMLLEKFNQPEYRYYYYIIHICVEIYQKEIILEN